MIRTNKGIPAYSENSVLRLIIACGSVFVAHKLIWVFLLLISADPKLYDIYVTANIAMPPVTGLLQKVWTIFTYSWVHPGFWVLFSNMVWLYAFGSLVQMLIGHRQLIPMFVYSMIAAGIFYQLAQLIPGAYFTGRTFMMGAQGGIVGLAVAALTLSPGYKFYLTEHMRIPLVLIAVIFFALQLMNANVQHEGAPLFLLGGGALMGWGYVMLLRNGYKPGDWVYNIKDNINNRFEIDDRKYVNRPGTRRNKTISMYNPKPKQGITQNRIDEILDKINQNGYDSLSKEDKDILLKAAGNKE